MLALLADYGKQTDFETFTYQDRPTIPNALAGLCGRRLVIASELAEGKRLAETVVKQVTGGDTIAARFLYGEFFEYTPAFKLWVGCNHKPAVRGTDWAIWRRIRLVPFTVVIPDDEIDDRLSDKLLTELPGILRWAVEGCREWQKYGLGMPAEVKGATQDYRDEMDILGTFLGEYTIEDPSGSAPSEGLYFLYKLWAENNKEYVHSHNKFGRLLRERGLKNFNTGKYWVWRGVKLNRKGELEFRVK